MSSTELEHSVGETILLACVAAFVVWALWVLVDEIRAARRRKAARRAYADEQFRQARKDKGWRLE